MSFFKKKKAFSQGITNFLIWCGVIILYELFRIGGCVPTTFNLKEQVLKLFSLSQVAVMVAAGAIAFLVMSVIRQKSCDNEERNRADQLNEVVLDEVGSVLFSFGSLSLLCWMFFETNLLRFVVTLITLYVGYWLKPTEKPVVGGKVVLD